MSGMVALATPDRRLRRNVIFSEGKHYNVAISHAVKKLVRVIYHLEKTKQQYITTI